MRLELGVKTDPIEHRYTHEWLFDLLADRGVRRLQLGSFFEMYWLEDDWFVRLREGAEARGLRIQSVFTSHRELGGFMADDSALEAVARRNYRRLVEVAAVLGADYAGSNVGAVPYDRMEYRERGLRRYIEHLKEMSLFAGERGLRGLTIEPMSCLAEPPTLPGECVGVMEELSAFTRARSGAAPVYFCGDISHGYADADRRVVADNWSLFACQIPYMCEFHFKNTDAVFESTFGFGARERGRGVVDLERLRALVRDNAGRFPVREVTGYLEINNVKFGRDYTDTTLGPYLRESLEAIRAAFGDFNIDS